MGNGGLFVWPGKPEHLGLSSIDGKCFSCLPTPSHKTTRLFKLPVVLTHLRPGTGNSEVCSSYTLEKWVGEFCAVLYSSQTTEFVFLGMFQIYWREKRSPLLVKQSRGSGKGCCTFPDTAFAADKLRPHTSPLVEIPSSKTNFHKPFKGKFLWAMNFVNLQFCLQQSTRLVLKSVLKHLLNPSDLRFSFRMWTWIISELEKLKDLRCSRKWR